jgi:hypothetical protein
MVVGQHRQALSTGLIKRGMNMTDRMTCPAHSSEADTDTADLHLACWRTAINARGAVHGSCQHAMHTWLYFL